MARYVDADSFGRYLNDWYLSETPYAEDGRRQAKTVCATIKACMDALDDMPAADVVPVVRWISVEERLPEKSGVYIIRSSTGKVYTDHFYHFTSVRGHFSRRGNTHVTHWMPLPEPPKEVQE